MKLKFLKYVPTSDLPGKFDNLPYNYGKLPNSTVIKSYEIS